MTGKFLFRLFVLGLCCFAWPAWAQSRKELLPSPVSLPLPVRCSASVEFGYQEGLVMQVNKVDSDKFTRKGASMGTECFFNFWQRRAPWFQIMLEARFNTGEIIMKHHTSSVDALVSGTVYGGTFRGGLMATTKYVDITLFAGAEITPEGRLEILDLELPLGDFTKFGKDHFVVMGSLKIIEAGLKSRLKFWRKGHFTGLSLTTDFVWQMYIIEARTTPDALSKRLLDAFKVDTSSLMVNSATAQTYQIALGLEYCYKSACVYAAVPFGVYNPDNWGAGVRLGARILFQP